PGREGFALAGRIEEACGVLRDLAHFVQLVQVHRVGELGTGSNIGDLALAAGAAYGDAVGSVRHRVGTKRHAVGSQCFREVAQGGAAGAGGPGATTAGGGVVAGCFRRNQSCQCASHGDAVGAAGDRTLAGGQAVVAVGAGIAAHGGAAGPGGAGAVADRGAV